jgi:MerR family transcriptional regulator, repressor of the yfmOP operon
VKEPTATRPVASPGRGPGAEDEEERLLGIGEAAARLGVSDRALRYYEEIGLLTPCGRTKGGMRRYSEDDLARVRRIRELQTLLGLNLDEVRAVLANEDRIAVLRQEYRARPAGSSGRGDVAREILGLREELRATVQAKIDGLNAFLADLDETIARVRAVASESAGAGLSGAGSSGAGSDGRESDGRASDGRESDSGPAEADRAVRSAK